VSFTLVSDKGLYLLHRSLYLSAPELISISGSEDLSIVGRTEPPIPPLEVSIYSHCLDGSMFDARALSLIAITDRESYLLDVRKETAKVCGTGPT
jgi:hypothetical protein